MGKLRLENLRKEFNRGQIVAVRDLNLEIEDGEFVTVVGPSGCGKTTTLRMLAGLETPTNGKVYIDGEDVTDLHAKNRDIAMVFQNYALYPHKTVMENMEFGLRMSTDLPKKERRDRVREIAKMMDIDELLNDKPDELSGGQKQRVALGRAIVREPKVFLFDEPLSNLDAKLRTGMRTEIQELQKEFGITSVYVTHDQEEAMTMGDRIVILNKGELQQVGPPTEVYDNPVNKFVAGFIGSPSMNFLEVHGQTTGDEVTLISENEEFKFNLSPEYVRSHSTDIKSQSYTLGIRPEKVSVNQTLGNNLIQATVQVVEPIGSDNYLHLDISDDFIARVDTDIEPDVGDRVGVDFNEKDIHLFHPESGKDIFNTDTQSEVMKA